MLTAVDSAVMVIDAARGIEAQTRKLFEVCRLRDMPVTTFINKMDRDGRDPFDLIDEVEQTLQIEVAPASWPIGMGRDFRGCWDLVHDRLLLMKRGKGETIGDGIACEDIDSPELDTLLPGHAVAQLRDEVEMTRELMVPFNRQEYLAGNLSPLYFGSALNNFGVRELIGGLVGMHRHPVRGRHSNVRLNRPRTRSPALSSRSRPTPTRVIETGSPSFAWCRGISGGA